MAIPIGFFEFGTSNQDIYLNHTITGQVQVHNVKNQTGTFLKAIPTYPESIPKDYVLDTSNQSAKTIIQSVKNQKSLKNGTIITYRINGAGQIIIQKIQN